jgi:cellulose synthase/poly-beta-1,6-N-acetylglucosamine synthase-like glycosyltransferase
MPSPRFSVVNPTREGAHTLKYTLQTCLGQDFDDFEVVVCDNGLVGDLSGASTVEGKAARKMVTEEDPVARGYERAVRCILPAAVHGAGMCPSRIWDARRQGRALECGGLRRFGIFFSCLGKRRKIRKRRRPPHSKSALTCAAVAVISCPMRLHPERPMPETGREAAHENRRRVV